jgi:hypothetical protein
MPDSLQVIKKMNELNIVKAYNGYILSWLEEDESKKIKQIQQVIEEDMDNEAGMINLLTTIAEHFGYCYNKYGQNNLDINFNKKGHKLEI